MDKEVEKFVNEQEEIVAELKEPKGETKQPTVAGGTTEDTEKTKEEKPLINNIPNTSNTSDLKEDITKRKKTINYLTNAKDSITKTLDFNQKHHWSKEEKILLRKVRAISNELGTIIAQLKIIPEQQAGMLEIQQQLAKQPVVNVKVEYATSREFSIIQEDTGATLVTGNKEVIKGFLKGYIVQQATATKTE